MQQRSSPEPYFIHCGMAAGHHVSGLVQHSFCFLTEDAFASVTSLLEGVGFFMHSLFHFAFHVTDLDAARRFYGDLLGCQEGRSTDTWVDFDFFGHQISLHVGQALVTTLTGKVDQHLVPMPHFGLVLSSTDWHVLAQRLQRAQIEFVIEPYLRFAGQPGEQWTMFFLDPFGNPIEIKGFDDFDRLYAR